MLAQPAATAPDGGPVPSFILMDVDGDHSKIELEGGFGFSTDEDSSGHLWTGRVRAQGMLDRTYGLYATLQGGGVTGGDDSDFGFADPEFGGVIHLATGASSAVSFHAGLVPGLTSDGINGSIAGATIRPVDLPLVAGGTSWLRGGVSAGFHDRAVFMRADLGIDQQLDGNNETFVHLNAGIGFGNQVVSAALELQTLLADGGDDHAESAGVSLHYTGATGAPYVAITTPFGDDFFSELVTLSVGASFPM